MYGRGTGWFDIGGLRRAAIAVDLPRPPFDRINYVFHNVKRRFVARGNRGREHDMRGELDAAL